MTGVMESDDDRKRRRRVFGVDVGRNLLRLVLCLNASWKRVSTKQFYGIMAYEIVKMKKVGASSLIKVEW